MRFRAESNARRLLEQLAARDPDATVRARATEILRRTDEKQFEAFVDEQRAIAANTSRTQAERLRALDRISEAFRK